MANIVITKVNKSIVIDYNDQSTKYRTDQQTISINSLSRQNVFVVKGQMEVRLKSGTLFSLVPSDIDTIEGVAINNIGDLAREFGKFFSLGDSVCSLSVNQELDTIDTAFNFYTPISGREIIITGIVATTGKTVSQTTPADIIIYEANAVDSTDIVKQLFKLELTRGKNIALLPLSLCVNEGSFINAKTTDATVFITIMGFFI